MNENELRDALMGLYAYDQGAIQSGIFDPKLKQRCEHTLKALPDAGTNFLSRLISVEFLSHEALAYGYSIEDVAAFINWLEEELDYGF
jgi:hypothetical protein